MNDNSQADFGSAFSKAEDDINQKINFFLGVWQS